MSIHPIFILFFILLSFSITGCQHQKKLTYDLTVNKNLASTNKTFKTIQAAINAVPDNAQKSYRIFIHPGQYYEKITITKPNIQLIGKNKDNTRLYYNAYAGQTYAAGKTWNTSGSATLTIQAENILIQEITIENTFDFLANDRLVSNDPKRTLYAQAVALFVDKGSNKTLVRNSRLLGYQDTLFVNSGRSWFDKTLIAGNVDFIFGNGNSLFTHSEIRTRARSKLYFPHGYLTAPSTQISEKYGLTFINCRLTRDHSVPDNSVPLGRPWHPTTQFADGLYADPDAIGKAVFIHSWMDSHIFVDGWYSMDGTAKDGTKTPFLPEDARFFEYKSKGPGAQINYKRRQLTNKEAKDYSRERILGDWKVE